MCQRRPTHREGAGWLPNRWPTHRLLSMSNPWLKKNPYLSMWLSGANAVAGAAQGRAKSTAKRTAATATRQATETVVSAWLTPFAVPKPRRKKRR